MATSSPPSKAIAQWATPHRAHSSDVPLSNSLASALDFVESLPEPEYVMAPLMPDPEAIKSAAEKTGLTPKQALDAYLSILAER